MAASQTPWTLAFSQSPYFLSADDLVVTQLQTTLVLSLSIPLCHLDLNVLFNINLFSSF